MDDSQDSKMCHNSFDCDRSWFARSPLNIARAGYLLLLLIISPLAAANPYISGVVTEEGLSSYSVSYFCPVTACYLEENSQFVGEWVESGNNGYLYVQDKPPGTYQYVLIGVSYPSGEMVQLGGASITVPVVNYPKPYISLTTLSAVGPFNNPYYYNFGWTAAPTHPNGCRLETSEQVMSTVLPGYVWNNQPATATVQIYPRYSQTSLVYYELTCTGPGGTSVANGALPF